MACAAGGTLLVLLVLSVLPVRGTPPRYSSRIVHTEQGAIRGIIVEPASRRLEPVEVFLGVPYAGRPARLAAPPPAPRWPGTRLADAAPPPCPAAASPPAAPLAEDCLRLSIYVPGSGARGEEAPYAVVAWLGAADGAVLAARAHLLVLSITYRVGLLGFLTADLEGAEGAEEAEEVERVERARRAGGAGLLDVVAALRWTARNVAAFGGDPARVTLAARGERAAHASALLMLPEADGLAWRVLLLSGGALSPAGGQAEARRRRVAAALGCGGAGGEALLRCVRGAPLPALLAAATSSPRARFLPAWPPCPPAASARAPLASPAFLHVALAVVVCSAESAPYFTDDEIRHGFEEEHRNRILRTFVRNVYRWHRNEIFAAVRNEYTDWEKPIQHPINIRDAALEALSDGAGAAPAARLAQLHARRGAPTYFAHFAHQGRDLDYPQRLGSVAEESEAYFLGAPLVGGAWGGRARNYSRADLAAAEQAVALLATYAKGSSPAAPAVVWPRYELATQQYLSIGARVRVRSHYRGHKLALWLHLVPQLHRPGAGTSLRHHQFRPDHADLFVGDVSPELYSSSELDDDVGEEGEVGPEEEETEAVEECVSAASALPSAPSAPSAPPPGTLATVDAQYYSYTVALGVTVCAGCVLLALNALVFAGIYLQRRPRPRPAHPPQPRRQPAPRVTHSSGSAGAGAGAGELSERPAPPAPPAKKRVQIQIQEISV